MSGKAHIDPEVVSQIVTHEEKIKNPYSDLGTLVGKLEDIKPYLVTIAREEDSLTTYIKTAHETGVFTARQSEVLGVLGIHEDEIGNPPLSAVVVQSKDDPMVGEKYFNMVRAARGLTNTIPESQTERRELWEKHLQDVRAHWTDRK